MTCFGILLSAAVAEFSTRSELRKSVQQVSAAVLTAAGPKPLNCGSSAEARPLATAGDPWLRRVEG